MTKGHEHEKFELITILSLKSRRVAKQTPWCPAWNAQLSCLFSL